MATRAVLALLLTAGTIGAGRSAPSRHTHAERRCTAQKVDHCASDHCGSGAPLAASVSSVIERACASAKHTADNLLGRPEVCTAAPLAGAAPVLANLVLRPRARETLLSLLLLVPRCCAPLLLPAFAAALLALHHYHAALFFCLSSSARGACVIRRTLLASFAASALLLVPLAEPQTTSPPALVPPPDHVLLAAALSIFLYAAATLAVPLCLDDLSCGRRVAPQFA